jgi:hypothetical protein
MRFGRQGSFTSGSVATGFGRETTFASRAVARTQVRSDSVGVSTPAARSSTQRIAGRPAIESASS